MGSGWFGKVYRASEWIMRLAYLNILWILFTLVGLIILGVFPSTTAMFSITRKWLSGDTELPIFKEYFAAFKREFKQANLLGYLFFMIGFFLYFDLRFAQAQEGFFHHFKYFFLTLLLFYYIALLYIFPIFSHYQMTTIQYIKHAFINALARPIQSALMVILSLAVSFLMRLVPGLIPFYSVSLLGLTLMWGALLSFPKSEEETEKILSSDHSS